MASASYPTRPFTTGFSRTTGAGTGNGGGAFGPGAAAAAATAHQQQQQRERERAEQERLDRSGQNQIGELSEEQREEINEAVQHSSAFWLQSNELLS